MSQPYPYGSTTASSGRQTPYARPSATPTGPARPTVILRLPDLRRAERTAAPPPAPPPSYAPPVAPTHYGVPHSHQAVEAPYSAAPTSDWHGMRHPVQYRYDPAWQGYGAPSLAQRVVAPVRWLFGGRPQVWLTGAILLALQAILGLLYLMLNNTATPVQTLPAPSIQTPAPPFTANHTPAMKTEPTSEGESEAELARRPRGNWFGPRSGGNSNTNSSSPASTPRIEMPQPTLAPPKDKKNDPSLFPSNTPKLGAVDEPLPWETGPATKEPTTASPVTPGLRPDRADLLNNSIQQTAVWTNDASSDTAAANADMTPSPKPAGKARLQGTVKKFLGPTP